MYEYIEKSGVSAKLFRYQNSFDEKIASTNLDSKYTTFPIGVLAVEPTGGNFRDFSSSSRYGREM